MAHVWWSDPEPRTTPYILAEQEPNDMNMAEPSQPSPNDLPEHLRKGIEKHKGK